MFGLGCRVGLEEPGSALRTQTPHPEHPKEGNLEHQECARGAAGGRAKETQPVAPQGSDPVHMGGKAVTTAAINLVLVGTKHSEARAALVTHITKIVFAGFINLHLYSCE